MKYLSRIIILTGVILIFLGGYRYFHSRHQIDHNLSTVKSNLSYHQNEEIKDKGDIFSFNPKHNKPLGVLKIPQLKRQISIIEGTGQKELSKGVGHYIATAFPGQGRPILLSGHRDTVFREFGKLKKGDRFIVKLPYGEYQYQMVKSTIVDADNQRIVQNALTGNKERLLLSTCYPFSYVGNAPKRYVIYASVVDENIK